MIDANIPLEEINRRNKGNMAENLGIEFIEINEEFLVARMPVDKRTTQPLGLLNGGASAALAEITGSVASYLSIDRRDYYTLGLEIKCNHLKSVDKGWVRATAKPIHLGRRTHLWQIEIKDEEKNLIALCTLTMAVMELSESMKEKYKEQLFDK